MSGCNDYWCEFYGRGGEQCERCVKKGVENESSQLQNMINRQVRENAEKGTSNSKEQGR